MNIHAIRSWLLAGLVVGVLAYINYVFWFYTEYRVGLRHDSSQYISWYWLRTPGYPAFISALSGLTGELRWLGVVQLNLLLAAYCALAYQFGRLVDNRVAGIILFLLLSGIVPLIHFSSLILTEALFAAMICLHLAALCCYLRRRTLWAATCIGATVFLIYILRPNGLPFAASLLLLIIYPPTPQNQGKGHSHDAGGQGAAGRGPAHRPGPAALGLGLQTPLWWLLLAHIRRLSSGWLCGPLAARR